MIDDTGDRLRQMQAEIREWGLANFGRQDPWMALLGMGEEYGEACDAISDRHAYLDAVGDFSIFLIHYCALKEWHIGLLWAARTAHVPTGRPWPSLLGRLMHHELKAQQNIRGTQREHDAAGQANVSALLRYMEHHLRTFHEDYVSVVEGVWTKVRERDWNAERARG